MRGRSLRSGDWVLAALFAATIAVVAAQVVWRYVFNDSLAWTEELSRYLFVWMTFIGAAVAVGERSHIRFTLLLSMIPVGVARAIETACAVLIAVLLAALVVLGFSWVRQNADTPTPALGLPLNVALYASLPVGALVGLLEALRQAAAVIRRGPAEARRSEGP